MEQDQRPVFTTQIGNTTIKIRSALPFMTPDEQKQWWKDNDSLPEVKMFKKAWIDSLISVAKAEAASECETA